MKQLIFTFLITWAHVTCCSAQMQTLTAAQPATNITCSLTDRSGNKWFCTKSGVYVYDGQQLFYHGERDGLPSSWIHCILEDQEGVIWLGTAAGVCRYDGQHFVQFPIPGVNSGTHDPLSYFSKDNTPRPSPGSILCIFQDHSGNIWFGTEDKGLFCYNHRYFTHFHHHQGNWNKTSGNSLMCLNFADEVITSAGVHQPIVQRLWEDKDGHIRFASFSPEATQDTAFHWWNYPTLAVYRLDEFHSMRITN